MSTIERRRERQVPPWVLVTGFAVIVVALLTWAKWHPYWVEVPSVADSHSLGSSILTGRSAASPSVSLSAGLSFAGTYFLAIRPALVAGLVIAAAVRTLLPTDWVTRTFAAGSGGAVRGGALAVHSMMCSCCAAPVAIGLRQRAASVTSSLTYWLANPALNPVVLIFRAFVLPWPWTVLRAVNGIVVVAGAVGLARSFPRRSATDAEVPPAEPGVSEDRSVPVRFLASLGWLTLRLVPEYVVLVVALGAFRGVLFPLAGSWAGGVTAATVAVVVGVVVLAVAGTLLPVPTGAEVAVVAALLAAGVSAPLSAALLITLPAVSLPSLLLVRRVFPRRLLLGVTVLVAVVGALTAAVAAAVG